MPRCADEQHRLGTCGCASISAHELSADSAGTENGDTMPYGQCTATVTGQHRTVSGAARCPVHGSGSSPSSRWTPRTPTWPAGGSATPRPATSQQNYGGQQKLLGDLSEQVLELMLTDTEDRVRTRRLS
jgi:hypothetical protein